MNRAFTYIKGRVALELTARLISPDDLVIQLTGGDRPHIGAVALAQLCPSLRNPKEQSTTTSLITCFGHKEDKIAKTMAEEIAKKSQKNTVVICGIHLDQITSEEIQDVLIGAEALEEEMLEWLSTKPG